MKHSISIPIIAFGTICSLPLLAQPGKGGDSAYLTWQSRTSTEMAHRNGTLMLARQSGDVGLVNIGVSKQWGAFRKAQEAQYGTTASFYTEGFKKAGKVHLEGSFLYNKVWEDSLANTMMGIHDDAQPFFFFAHKAGKYERQNYLMKATAAIPVLENKLYFSTGVDYKYHWTTRSIDPRPEVNDFHLLLRPELSWKKGAHNIGAHLVWGYGNEENGISYKIRDYAANLTYEDRNSMMSLGYGNIKMMQGQFFRHNNFSGFGASYAWGNGPVNLRWTAQYLLKEEENTIDASRKEYAVFGKVQTESVQSDLLLERKTVAQNEQLSLHYYSGNTLNYVAELFGVNYQYHKTSLQVGYISNIESWKGKPEFGLSMNFASWEKEDLTAAHQVQYATIQPQLRAAIHASGNAGTLRAAVAPGVYLPLTAELSLPPTQENRFTRWVVYPDHLYHSAKALVCDAEILFFPHDLLKHTSAAFSARFNFSAPITGSEKETLPGTPPVSGTRSTAELGFKLFL